MISVHEPSPVTPPQPPYYAVVFASTRTSIDGAAYERAAEAMADLASRQPGYLGMDSARGADGLGITVSYWRDEKSIAAWRDHVEHAAARHRGRESWYSCFALHVARVERSYGFPVHG